MSGLVILGNPAPPPISEQADNVPAPLFHLLPGDPPLIFLVNGSRLFEVVPELFAELISGDENAQFDLLDAAKPWPPPPRDAESRALSAISLNIAQSCNLSCSYCYADEGRFGGHAAMMSSETAMAAINRLLQDARGRRVTIGFIGGEPFLNRDLLYSSVDYALARATKMQATVRFSVTTNGTLLTAHDLEFLREHAFAISVSLDGSSQVNDAVRRTRNGTSGFELAMRALAPLLHDPGKARIAGRVTVTRADLQVLERIEALLGVGFTEVGVSPLRTSPCPGLALVDRDWPVFLREMVRAAEAELRHLRETGSFRFSNLAIAMRQLHAGHCKPLPCGAAASYVSVSARGEYFTCHRTVDNRRSALGDIQEGLSASRREAFLRSRQVDEQQPCRSCWARYLCGGGCHAEVLTAGRSGCDYIRGWLEYCLRTYDRVVREFPAWFQEGGLA